MYPTIQTNSRHLDAKVVLSFPIADGNFAQLPTFQIMNACFFYLHSVFK